MMKGRQSSKKNQRRDVESLPTIRPLVAGIDIGSREHWVCGPANADGAPNVRVFRTTTDDLKKLVDWLREQRVASVVMESTSVYWIPLYEMLESQGIEAVLVNARQLHNVPGRKTDYRDCQWLQLLHSCGLLRGSFRPSDAIVALRAIQRQMANLVEERTRCVQWMQKALDQMNVQVHHAVSDLAGTTGLAIVRAIVAGDRSPSKRLARYLTGNWREEHLFNLASALRLFDGIEEQIRLYEDRLLKQVEALAPPERQNQPVPQHPKPNKEKYIRNHREQPARRALWQFAGLDLFRIDGIGVAATKTILTEIGLDLSAFPTERHFISWLRLCPRTAISGGKPLRHKRNGMGANRVAAALRMAASTLSRSKTALGAAYRRIARLKSASVAIFATARKLAQLVYRMLRFGQDYTDIGETAYDLRFQVRRLASLKQSAKALGYALTPDSSVPATG